MTESELDDNNSDDNDKSNKKNSQHALVEIINTRLFLSMMSPILSVVDV